MYREEIKKILLKNLENYNRLDIIVRYMYIEYYFNKNNKGKELYNKMQKKRVPEEYKKKNFLEIFNKTIEEFKTGLNDNFPLILNENLNLVDGSHRLSCCLYFDIKGKINYTINNTKVNYDIKWFEENFKQEELKIIKEKYHYIINFLNMGE